MKQLSQLESRMFSSLANPKRIEILHLLQHGSATVSEIVEMTNIPQANVSQHLAVMRRLGLVVSTKEAQIRRYSISSKHVIHICDAMRRLLLERYGVTDLERLDELRLHVDPVCGMEIAAHQAQSSHVHGHRRYYFCGNGCAKKFTKNPNAYIEIQSATVSV